MKSKNVLKFGQCPHQTLDALYDFFYVSEGIYQFKSIFELVKMSIIKVRTLVLSGLPPTDIVRSLGHLLLWMASLTTI